MMDIREFMNGEDFKFLKWVEIITDERDAVKLSAMYILQKDLNFCDVIFVSDKGKKRRVGGISKQVLEQDFPLLDLSNLTDENKQIWKEQLGGLKGDPGKIPDHQWVGTSLRFEKPDGSFDSAVNLKGDTGAKGDSGERGLQGIQGIPGEKGENGELSLINFSVDDNMNLHLEIQPNTGLEFYIDENGNLIINN